MCEQPFILQWLESSSTGSFGYYAERQQVVFLIVFTSRVQSTSPLYLPINLDVYEVPLNGFYFQVSPEDTKISLKEGVEVSALTQFHLIMTRLKLKLNIRTQPTPPQPLG